MNSFSFTLYGKLFICPSILNDSFAGWTNLDCRSQLFITLNTSFQSLLACKVSFEKSADSIMGTPLQVTLCFSLAAFNILSLSLTFGILIIICPGVGLFPTFLFGTLLPGLACLCPSSNQGSFLSLFFQIDFQSLVLSLLPLSPLDANVGLLKVVPQAAYTILIFLDSFFLLF